MMLPIFASVGSFLLKKGITKLGTLVAGGSKEALKEVGNVLGVDIDAADLAGKSSIELALQNSDNLKLLVDYDSNRMPEIQ